MNKRRKNHLYNLSVDIITKEINRIEKIEHRVEFCASLCFLSASFIYKISGSKDGDKVLDSIKSMQKEAFVRATKH